MSKLQKLIIVTLITVGAFGVIGMTAEYIKGSKEQRIVRCNSYFCYYSTFNPN